MSYKISVIIPVYNAEDTLERAILSILNQNWKGDLFEDVEIICVDDNSSDSSLDIIKKLASKNSNITYYSFSDNSGFGGRGRNKGIELSNSEFIMFMDNDDEYLLDALQILYDSIIKEKSDWVGANLKSDSFVGDVIVCPKYDGETTLNPRESIETFNYIANGWIIAPWGKIYNSNFIKNNYIRFLEDTQLDDGYFFIQCLLNAKKVTLINNEYVYMNYTYDDSQIHSHTISKFNSFLKGVQEIANILTKDKIDVEGVLKRFIPSLLLILTNINCSNDEKRELMKNLNEFEKNYSSITLGQKELNLLNNAILDEKYSYAIYLCKIYRMLYGNSVIRVLYRMMVNIKYNAI